MIRPRASTIGAGLSVPIQTAVDSDGVYPTIQASELSSSDEPYGAGLAGHLAAAVQAPARSTRRRP